MSSLKYTCSSSLLAQVQACPGRAVGMSHQQMTREDGVSGKLKGGNVAKEARVDNK